MSKVPVAAMSPSGASPAPDGMPGRAAASGRGARASDGADAAFAPAATGRGSRTASGPVPARSRPRCPARALVLPALAVAAVLGAVAGLLVGATGVGPGELWALATGGEVDAAARAILVDVRAPRVLAGLLAGCALAVSGAIIQMVLDNPLASPNIIGVNAGAGLFVLLCGSLAPGAAALLPAGAFAGAVLTALFVLGVSACAGSSRLTLVLVGVAASAILGAGMDAVLIADPDAYVGASSFLVGGLSSVRMGDLAWPAVYIAAGLVAAFAGVRALNVASMGESLAAGVGMDVRRCRLVLMLVAALLAGAAVSFAGLVGFVGLVVPHMVRFAVGGDMRVALPANALAGATVLCLCDTLARTLFAPYELPVGILMALAGGTFFVVLVCRNGRRAAHV